MLNPEINTGKNRGKKSEDNALFSSLSQKKKLADGLKDMFYLLSKGYAAKSSLELVGNRYKLTRRQMLALQGMSCSENALQLRKNKELKPEELKNQDIFIDGFNFLILIESLLSEAYIFKGIDGCYRDLSSVHGTYRKVNQTENVLVTTGKILQELNVHKVTWIFDRPVSNSGRIKNLGYEIAQKHGYNWEIVLDNSPDKFLVHKPYNVISSDAWVLDKCYRWFNLGAFFIKYSSLNYSENILNFN